MPEIGVEERRARLAVRHHLAKPARDPVTVAGDLNGLHASDPATVYLAARARVRGFTVADLERLLYDERSLVKMLGMRRTMFVVPVDLAETMDAACTQALAPGERKRAIRLVEEGGLADDGKAWLERVEQETLDALDQLGEGTAAEIGTLVPDLKKKISMGEGKKWAGEIGMSTRVLFLLATEGRVVRGRPLGTWLSSQYRWTHTDHWLGRPLDPPAPPVARAELVRRWLRTYGPGTFTDVKWWTKWTVRDTKAALADAGAVTVDLDAGDGSVTEGYVLADDVGSTRRPKPWVAFLPSLDPTVMGWKDRAWYLGPHQAALYDTNGNAGATIWSDGRIVGGWGQHEDATVGYELLEAVDAATEERIAAEAERVETWMAGVRVIPRFRTPLDRTIAARPGRP